MKERDSLSLCLWTLQRADGFKAVKGRTGESCASSGRLSDAEVLAISVRWTQDVVITDRLKGASAAVRGHTEQNVTQSPGHSPDGLGVEPTILASQSRGCH